MLALGFAVVALRQVWLALERPRGRLLAALLASAIAGLFVWPTFPPANLLAPALTGLLIAAVLSTPVFAILGLLVLLVGVLLITYFPPLTTALPHLLSQKAR